MNDESQEFVFNYGRSVVKMIFMDQRNVKSAQEHFMSPFYLFIAKSIGLLIHNTTFLKQNFKILGRHINVVEHLVHSDKIKKVVLT